LRGIVCASCHNRFLQVVQNEILARPGHCIASRQRNDGLLR
jgi:hypothetical protein